MVIPRHRLADTAVRSLLALCVVSTLCQCKTRTITTRESSFKFDDGMWGGQGGNDSGEIRKKFAEKGYTIAEDGSIKADKPDLFAGEKARGFDGKVGKKEAKFGNTEARTSEFKTPEYIKRQEFAGTGAARESGSAAREGSSSDRESRKLFQSKTSRANQLATFETGTAAGTSERFSTSSDAVGSEGIANAPRASGVYQASGYRANAGMTVDDVKKMLSPNVYAIQKGL